MVGQVTARRVEVEKVGQRFRATFLTSHVCVRCFWACWLLWDREIRVAGEVVLLSFALFPSLCVCHFYLITSRFCFYAIHLSSVEHFCGMKVVDCLPSIY